MAIQKKIIGMLCLILIITGIFSACGKKGRKGKEEITINNSYQMEQFQVDGIPEEVNILREFSNMIWLAGKREGKSCLGNFAISKPDYQEMILELPKNETIVDFYINIDEDIYIVTSEMKKEQENYLEQLRLYHCFKEGTIEMLSELKACDKSYKLCMTEENIYLLEEGLYISVFDKKGKQHSTSESRNRIEAICGDGQNCYYIMGDITSNSIIGTIDENGKVVEIGKTKIQIGDDPYIIPSGTKEDEIYYIDRKSIYKIKKKKMDLERILSWDNFYILGNDLISVLSLRDGGFFCFNKKEHYFQQIQEENEKQQTEEEEDTIEEIVFASRKIQGTDIERIQKFNKEHDDCKIVTRDYSIMGSSYETFNLDVASGDIPDIVNLSSIDPIMLAKKGMFTDLSVFMEKDAEVSKEAFLDSLIKLLEIDGENIYFLTPNFRIETLVGSKKDIGDHKSWTLEEFEDFCKEKKAEGKQIFPIINSPSYAVLNSRYTMEDYIDLNTGKVDFLTKDFQRMLSIAKDYFNLELNVEQHAYKSVKDGIASLMEIHLYSLSECLKYKWVFGKDGYSFIGYPSKDDSLTGIAIEMDEYYAITDNCTRKEEAWEFLRQYFLKESKGTGNSIGLPVRKDVMEYQKECLMAKKAYTNKKGEEVIPLADGDIDMGDGVTIKKRPLKKKEIKQLDKLIQSADVLSIGSSIYIGASNIVGDEVNTGFRSGKSIEEIMDVIQSRVSLMVSEES